MGRIYFKYTSILLPSAVVSTLLLLEWCPEPVLLCMVALGGQAYCVPVCAYMYIHAPYLQKMFTDNGNYEY